MSCQLSPLPPALGTWGSSRRRFLPAWRPPVLGPLCIRARTSQQLRWTPNIRLINSKAGAGKGEEANDAANVTGEQGSGLPALDQHEQGGKGGAYSGNEANEHQRFPSEEHYEKDSIPNLSSSSHEVGKDGGNRTGGNRDKEGCNKDINGNEGMEYDVNKGSSSSSSSGSYNRVADGWRREKKQVMPRRRCCPGLMPLLATTASPFSLPRAYSRWILQQRSSPCTQQRLFLWGEVRLWAAARCWCRLLLSHTRPPTTSMVKPGMWMQAGWPPATCLQMLRIRCQRGPLQKSHALGGQMRPCPSQGLTWSLRWPCDLRWPLTRACCLLGVRCWASAASMWS
mmetsp:Transcript_3706/g.10022  ORF Transcript_3706/g.10022 Transcript_3706/m.10022 type:complete len:340 (-) Transcript_3706:1015-2034(-)